jgi:hypothetical protein
MFVRVLHRPASRLRACPPGLLIRSRSPQDLLLVGLTAGRGFSFVSWRTQPSVPFQAPGHAAAFDLRARLAYPRRRPRIRTEPTDQPTVPEGIALVRPYVSVSTMQQLALRICSGHVRVAHGDAKIKQNFSIIPLLPLVDFDLCL